MDKSLTPLIAVLAAVVFLTVIVLNSDLASRELGGSPVVEERKAHEVGIMPAERSLILSRDPGHGRVQTIFPTSKMMARVVKLLSEQREAEAEDVLRTILVLEPENMKALSLLGGLLYYAGRYEEADFIFKRQTQISPSAHLVYNRLSSSQCKQGRYDEAVKSGELAFSMDPDSAEIALNLAGLYSLTGKKDIALIHFKKAYEGFGSLILPLSHDRAFDNIRDTREFREIMIAAQSELDTHGEPAEME
ncbi:MAG: tetratricopeptide repeat protein [Victivallales bacterium]|nr:tetratricopeptide repeat protein [Victivallales bacterium]